MSCSELRRPLRTLVAGAALALVAGTTACGTGAAAESVSAAADGTAADATTRRLAEVEFVRQCEIDSMSFAEEAGITADLDDRLAAAGFTHQQWKEWHDALADSPALVDQFAEISAVGCPAG
ncbi:hypothetical protein GCM10023328_33710 [Modestobacter marinus]|uniref:Lipoprotein n=1 Tax=Modestobacter marinus TaxID=477641 RepID=A0A846LFM7_9ACTN|nr:hypothetical protein [Modestobacter marinus]NIH66486.1 hypothetical protein [Modestobacter marinus]GGL64046.1 hypothetical protein GCM10011589_20310 [Modestobacter marinus]